MFFAASERKDQNGRTLIRVRRFESRDDLVVFIANKKKTETDRWELSEQEYRDLLYAEALTPGQLFLK